MKENWEKIKELSKNKYTKPILFFGFYFVFFAVVMGMMSVNNSNKEIAVKKNAWENITNNYEYLYEIQFDNNVITLEGKRYNHKNLFIKKINNIVDSEIYTFYNSISIKKENIWSDTNSVTLVNNDFDNNILDIDYLKNIISDSELVNSTTNFDGTKSEIYNFNGTNIEVVSENSNLRKLNILKDSYKIFLQYKNINKVEDFTVEK